MNPKIDLSESTVLHAVWELEDGYWQLITITRLRCAIALARESLTTRLVFPTGVFPNGVWGGEIYKNGVARTNSKKVDSLQQRREKVLQLLSKSPGQSRDSLAPQLDVSVATVGQLLRHLEKLGDIYHRPHPIKNQVKLYYVGATPVTTGTSANKSTSKPVPRLRKEPPLKVYFVEPRTLQTINQ